MFADDGQRHLVRHRFVDRLTEAHADDFGIRLDVEWSEGFLDQLEVVAPIVGRKGCAIAIEWQRIGGIHNWKRPAGHSIAEAQRIAVAGQVVVHQCAHAFELTDQRGLIVVHFHDGMKRLLVLDTDIQLALARCVARFELGIDSLDPPILLKDLQLVLQRFHPTGVSLPSSIRSWMYADLNQRLPSTWMLVSTPSRMCTATTPACTSWSGMIAPEVR